MTLPRLSSRPPGPGQNTSPGAFNRWITFYNPPNRTSGRQASPFVDSWAAVRLLSSSENDRAQQIAQKATHLITVPFQHGILESMQIGMYEGATLRMFQIAGLGDPDGGQVELRITAFEINQNAGSSS